MSTKSELEREWCDLLDIPLYRKRTDAEDIRLTELTAALYPKPEADNATLTARLAQLEAEIDEAPYDAARKMLEEIIEIRNRLQLDGGADDRAEWAMRQKYGEAL